MMLPGISTVIHTAISSEFQPGINQGFPPGIPPRIAHPDSPTGISTAIPSGVPTAFYLGFIQEFLHDFSRDIFKYFTRVSLCDFYMGSYRNSSSVFSRKSSRYSSRNSYGVLPRIDTEISSGITLGFFKVFHW